MPPYPTVTMRNGDRGDHVRQLQALLNRDYPAYSKLDGRRQFGPQDRSRNPRVSAPRRIAGHRHRRLLDTGETRRADGPAAEAAAATRRNAVSGVYVGSSTSCEFAHNVREEYFSRAG